MAGQQQSPVHKKLMMPRSGLQVPSLRLICSRHLSFNEHVQYHQGERLAEQPRVPIYLYSQETFYPRILIALHFVFFKKTKQTTTTTTTTKSLRNSLHVISTVNEGEAPSNSGALLGTKRSCCCCCCYYCHQGPLNVHRIQRVKQDGILIPLKRVCLLFNNLHSLPYTTVI